jgi:hypothetical protein
MPLFGTICMLCVCAAWQDYDILLSVRYYSECCLPAPFINDKIMG